GRDHDRSIAGAQLRERDRGRRRLVAEVGGGVSAGGDEERNREEAFQHDRSTLQGPDQMQPPGIAGNRRPPWSRFDDRRTDRYSASRSRSSPATRLALASAASQES